MKRSDSFRKFFPGHVSVDKIIQNDESNSRKRSQVSSNTQSQEFRSQSSHFHSSLNTLTSDSQVSSSNRYDDMLASGRHLELKDTIETIRKTVSALTSQISSQQVALSSNANQLHDIRKDLSDIKAAQDAQDRTLSVMCELLFEIKNNLQEMKNSRKSSPTSEFSNSEEEHDIESASQNVMSLDDYLVNRAKRARIASPSGSARDSAQGDDDVSMSSGIASSSILPSKRVLIAIFKKHNRSFAETPQRCHSGRTAFLSTFFFAWYWWWISCRHASAQVSCK